MRLKKGATSIDTQLSTGELEELEQQIAEAINIDPELVGISIGYIKVKAMLGTSQQCSIELASQF